MGEYMPVGEHSEHEVPFEDLVCEVWSAMAEFAALDVRTQSAWADVWGRATANRGQPPEVPGVDWSRQWVLFVATGVRPSTGYRVEIRRLVRRDRVIHVYAVETVPPPGSVTGCAITHPMHAVTMPQEPDDVSFEFHFAREVPEL